MLVGISRAISQTRAIRARLSDPEDLQAETYLREIATIMADNLTLTLEAITDIDREPARSITDYTMRHHHVIDDHAINGILARLASRLRLHIPANAETTAQ